MRVLLIYNPAAGRRRAGLVRSVAARCRRRGIRISIERTRRMGHARTLAQQGVADGYDRIVAAGGDGTVGEVASALAGSGIAMAILPVGTANAAAHELGLTGFWGPDAARLGDMIAHGAARPVYLGHAAAQGAARDFILMTGAGFDGEIIRDIDLALKRRFGKLAYVAAGAAAFAAHRPHRLAVTADGADLEADWAVVSNGRFYGGPFVLAPDESLLRPGLTLVTLERADRWSLAKAIARFGVGRVAGLGGLAYRRVSEVTLRALDGGGVPVQADGDPAGQTPVRIRRRGKPVMVLLAAQ